MSTTSTNAESYEFEGQYIGTLDVPRPSSRVEIVAAMRRIRYEFKAKAIKKKKVNITVSVEGVKVVLRKKKKKPTWAWDETRLLVMHHPIYRIFYVSHDSQDLKIWSYIARDGPTNVFRCNVFKAYKKSQAMRIVRTIGQAFEVCHKLSTSQNPININGETPVDSNSTTSVDDSEKHLAKHFYSGRCSTKGERGLDDSESNSTDADKSEIQEILAYANELEDPEIQEILNNSRQIRRPAKKQIEAEEAKVQQQPRDEKKHSRECLKEEKNTPPRDLALAKPAHLTSQIKLGSAVSGVGGIGSSVSGSAIGSVTSGTTIVSPMSSPVLLGDYSQPEPSLPLSRHHQVQLLRQQLEQQQQQTQIAIAQVHLLKDQLAAETAARIEAQARAHQLLLHNRDLLDHVAQLIDRIQDLEMKVNGISASSERLFQTTPQIPVLPDPTTPQAGPVYLPDFRDVENTYLNSVPENAMFENKKTEQDTDSPDSGHKEMSSDSLSCNLTNGTDSKCWQYDSFCRHSQQPGSNYSNTNASGANTTSARPLTPHQNHSVANQHHKSYNNNNNINNNMNNNNINMNNINNNNNNNNNSNPFSKNNLVSPKRRDDIKIITPVPAQDASGNRLELKLGIAPKIDPPPKYTRSPRPLSVESDTSANFRDTNANTQHLNQRNRQQNHSDTNEFYTSGTAAPTPGQRQHTIENYQNCDYRHSTHSKSSSSTSLSSLTTPTTNPGTITTTKPPVNNHPPTVHKIHINNLMISGMRMTTPLPPLGPKSAVISNGPVVNNSNGTNNKSAPTLSSFTTSPGTSSTSTLALTTFATSAVAITATQKQQQQQLQQMQQKQQLLITNNIQPPAYEDICPQLLPPCINSDDDNSEDSGLPIVHQMPRRLDSMTFDEFEALSS